MPASLDEAERSGPRPEGERAVMTTSQSEPNLCVIIISNTAERSASRAGGTALERAVGPGRMPLEASHHRA